MASKKASFITKPYSGYYHAEVPADDREFTRCGPGTPAGEYLRRFWHPVAYTHQINDLPIAIKIMCEELVLFKEKGGHFGLLELHCSHRGTSLEFGRVEEGGIRCCYHGWKYGVDGRILEMPGKSPDSTYMERLCHGAYPVTEYSGIVFAYMGPPEKMPEFPWLDLYDTPGFKLGPGEPGGVPNVKPCNWLQIVDNLLDPFHEQILHATISGTQVADNSGRLVDEFAIMGEMEYLETSTGFIDLTMRRINQNTVWVRNEEFIWPNRFLLSHPPNFPHEWGPDQTEEHIIPAQIFWVTPIDDTTSMEITYGVNPVGEADARLRNMMPATRANMGGRPYEEMQRFPGDFEAQTGQRAISVHALEHLGEEDRGVMMLRKGLRRRIRMIKQGQEPPELAQMSGNIASTCGGDTLLKADEAPTPEADKRHLRHVGHAMAKRYIQNGPNVPGSARSD